MSFEQTGPTPGPQAQNRRPASEQWGTWGTGGSDEQTQPRPAAPAPPPAPNQPPLPVDPQFAIHEHVSGVLPVHPSEAPRFRPAYNPYAQSPAQPPSPYGPVPPQGQPRPAQPPQGYVPGQPYPAGYPQPPYPGVPAYNGYPYPYGYPPYGWSPPRPKRDGYSLAAAIVSVVGAGLAILGGLGSALFLFILIIIPRNGAISDASYFSSTLTFLSFVVAGIVGGGVALYHSIRALLQKPSATARLPWFWLSLILYLFVLGAAYALQANGHSVTYPIVSIFLIALAAIFPALALASLGVRRLRFPTSWRRFALALVSGATLGIGLALLLELGLTLLVLGSQGSNFFRYIDDPSAAGNQPVMFNLIFLIVAVIGPLVEETVKPLGVAFYIGRMRSAAESFTLGMAAGIGFALVETVGYIGAGYQNWLTVALERTGASLLHGFGAGMVALGWYYLTHRKQGNYSSPGQGWLLAILCWVYAVFQHFVWNGTAILSLLPAPVGPTIGGWTLNLGFTTLSFLDAINIVEAILILLFFIYMTGRLRKQTPGSGSPSEALQQRPAGEPQVATRV